MVGGKDDGSRDVRATPDRRPAGTQVIVAVAVVTVSVGAIPVVADATTQTGVSAGETALLQDDGPTAALVITPNPAHPGEVVTLDARNSTGAPNDDIARCDFDTDGDSTYEESTESCILERSYEATGEYDISVRVTTVSEQTATDSELLQVFENEPPTPAIAVDPAAPRPGDAVVLSAADAADPDGEIVTFEWTVDGQSLSGETVETEFDAVGEYEVALSVTDDDGATATAGEVLAVEPNQGPTAAVVAEPTTVTVGGTVTLYAGESTDPDGPIAEYRWDLDGDGTVDRTTDAARTSYTVDAAGRRDVGVTVVDDLGATDAATVTVTVATPTPASGGTGDRATPPAWDTAGGDGRTAAGPLALLDPGVVPLVPDWVVLLGLVALVALGVAHRREPIPSRVRSIRERLHEGEFRRNLAQKGVGAAAKTAFKKLFRGLADGVEASGKAVGDLFEYLGRAIKRGSKRVADALRSLGG